MGRKEIEDQLVSMVKMDNPGRKVNEGPQERMEKEERVSPGRRVNPARMAHLDLMV